ncbi:MAG: 5'/3'-nucleotidase SurE [Anaerolineaceae bacterium]
MPNNKVNILLTNDDGIDSPGLWAAAEALSALGYVTIAAPRDQCSGMGRSTPTHSDGIIKPIPLTINGQEWTVYSVGGSPAQCIQHALLEIMSAPPALIVSGINYGENLGTGITISGTIGAALEGAEHGIPALAVSLQLVDDNFLHKSDQVDFSAAGYFTYYFAKKLLMKQMPADVHAIKVDIPFDATPETPWKIARLGQQRYFVGHSLAPTEWERPYRLRFNVEVDPHDVAEGSDIQVMRFDRQVAVTPLSLDLTSRVDLPDFEQFLRNHDEVE